MKYAVRLCLVVLLCGIAISPQHVGSATFFDPIGDSGLLSKGDEAAARLNEALAAVHLLYAAFERKEVEGVQNYQKQAVERLTTSITLLQEVAELAGEKPVVLIPKNDEEKEMLTEFERNIVNNYKLPIPRTQKDLAALAVTIVTGFKSQLSGARIDPRSADLNPLWSVMRSKIYLEQTGLAVSIVWSKSRN